MGKNEFPIEEDNDNEQQQRCCGTVKAFSKKFVAGEHSDHYLCKRATLPNPADVARALACRDGLQAGVSA